MSILSVLCGSSDDIFGASYMNAEKYNLERIYFGGCFIRGRSCNCSHVIRVQMVSITLGHAATITTLSYAIRFWSKGTKRALFLRHEGFLSVYSVFALVISQMLIVRILFLSAEGQ